MSSPRHQANILDPTMVDTGIAVLQGPAMWGYADDPAVIFVQTFAYCR